MTNVAFLVGCILLAQVSDRYNAAGFGPGPSDSAASTADEDTVDSWSKARSNTYEQPRRTTQPDPYGAPPRTTSSNSRTPVRSPARESDDPYAVAPTFEDMQAMGFPHDQASDLQNNDSFDAAAVAKNAPSPTELMRAMLTAPSRSRLKGRPTDLAEVIQGASSRRDQTQRVEAYWDLCSSVSDHYLALHEQQELKRLRPMFKQVGDAWRQADAEMGVRVGTSERAAIAQQYRLARLMGRSEKGPLPLPADMPHCGDYFTRYEDIFSGRPSQEAAQLSELLPLRYNELKATGIAVVGSEAWLDWVASQRSTASDGTGVVRALELLALRRRAFVQIARDYNRRIARYAELAAPGEIDPRQLIGMLIQADDRLDTATRPGSGFDDDRQSRTQPKTPQTFVADWTEPGEDGMKAVIPATAFEAEQGQRVERSVLVRP